MPYKTNIPPTRGVPGTTSLCRPQNRANIEKSEIQDPQSKIQVGLQMKNGYKSVQDPEGLQGSFCSLPSCA